MAAKNDRPGLREALQALKKRKAPATEGDRPPVTPAPGPRRKILPGQLDFDGTEH